MRIQSPKGTRDFYPPDMRRQNQLFSVWHSVCRTFGFEEYEGPMFESLELFTQKSGEEIVSQLYHFKDKGNRNLALRPEITPTLARMVNQKGPGLKMPLRWYSIPRLFRYERAQKGRLREFFQLNMDIIGCDGIQAETELISAVIEMLLAFGLTAGDFYVGISSRRLLKAFFEHLKIPPEAIPGVYALMDKKSKMSSQEYDSGLRSLSLPDNAVNSLQAFTGISDPAALAQWEHITPVREAIEELRNLLEALVLLEYGDCVKLDLSIIRGLAYYTGPVFEVFDKDKRLRAIAGGGRYDNLMENLGGNRLSGVGFGIGDVVLWELLKAKKLLKQGRPQLDYYLANFTDTAIELLSLGKILRRRGKTVAYSLQPAKMKKQLASAEEMGAQKVIFVGSDRVSKGLYEVKNLATRQQTAVSLDEL